MSPRDTLRSASVTVQLDPPAGGFPLIDASRGLKALDGWQLRPLAIHVCVMQAMHPCSCGGDCERTHQQVLVTALAVMPDGTESDGPDTTELEPSQMPPWLRPLVDVGADAARTALATITGGAVDGD